jgi:hypothetical protein
MMLSIYVLAILSNMIVIMLLPNDGAQAFLASYSVSSLILGVCVVYAFSTPRWLRALDGVDKWISSVVFFVACASIAVESPVGLALAYVASLLYSDYCITQRGGFLHVLFYRVGMVFSVVPALFGVPGADEWMIPVRIFFALGCLASLSFGGRSLGLLSVGRPWVYVIGTHFFYFGSLALFTFLLTDPALRIWYVGSQIGHGLVLKLMDFRIRRGAEVSDVLQWGVAGMSLTIGIGLAYISWQPIAAIAYLVALLGLQFITRSSVVK